MNPELKRKRSNHKASQDKYMKRHQTLCVTLSKENDKDIIDWLGRQENRSESVRETLREVIRNDG